MANGTYPIQTPITIWTGADYVRNFYYQDSNGTPIPLIDYTAKLEGRQTTAGTNPPVVEADTNNYLTVTGTLGLVSLLWPATYTENLPLINCGVWDLFVYGPGGEPSIRLVGGVLNINESVTR